MNEGVFPDELKHEDIIPIYKKESRNEKKKNYRPVSILPNLPKIFERCMHDQLKDYFDKILSKYQCELKKALTTQHCLLAMIAKLRKSFDSGEASASLLTDLSKAFDCLPHALLIAKLHPYGTKKGSLNLSFSYLKNKKQRVRLNNTYIEWIEILFGMPQGSILGPLLFNIFLCDFFLFLHDIPVANYADDNIPYCTSLKISDSLIKLKNAAETLLQ